MEPIEPQIELPTPTEAIGSMAAFFAMRKRQQDEAASKAPTTKTPTTAKASVAATENVLAENVLPDIEQEQEAGYLLSFLLLVGLIISENFPLVFILTSYVLGNYM